MPTVAVLTLLGACATPAPTPAPDAVQLPLLTAWYENRVVRYITTDVSDAAVAQAKGANFVPRLKDLLPESGGTGSSLERVYAFADGTQPTVFPSVPLPVGGGSKSLGYTPLWRMVQVQWKKGLARRELRSEEAILDAEERGDVRLVTTDVVLNCPVLAVEGAGVLRGVTLGGRAAAAP
jgi:hypothetical protein